MANKNLILFITLGSLVIVGWVWLQQSWTPPAKKSDQAAKVTPKDEKKTEPPPKKDDKTKKPETPPAKPKEVVKEEPVKPNESITLGGEEDYYIKAILTSRGAGVRELTLTKFQGANWLGLPLPDDAELQLIQDDPFQPSFRLYHYPDGNPNPEAFDAPPPVTGLGEKHWKFLKKETKDSGQEATFLTRVPGLEHIEITKTYRLEPRTYHLTLTLRIRNTNTRTDGETVPFRYQLTGGYGLPIEGEWYTSTFRNALIALVEDGRAVREFESSDRISHRGGGDRVPERARGAAFVQYAAVVNQYFASVIVPDNKQPSADEGGVLPENVLAWARPTLETTEAKGAVIEMDGKTGRLLFQEMESSAAISTRRNLQQKVTIDLKEVGLNDFFKVKVNGELSSELRYKFDEATGISNDLIVSYSGEAVTVKKVLDELADKYDFGYFVLSDAGSKDDGKVVIRKSKKGKERGYEEPHAAGRPVQYKLLPRVTPEYLAKRGIGSLSRATIYYYTTPEGLRVATWIRPGHASRPQLDDITVRVNSEKLELSPGQAVVHQFLLYHGPVKTRLLGYRNESEGEVNSSLVERYTDTLHLGTLTDYRSPGWPGRVSQAIYLTNVIIAVTRAMHGLLWLLSCIAPSGLSIILLTVIVRGLMFPISRRTAMVSVRMQALAPEIKKIQEKYKNDAQAKGQAMMELYRKHGVSPLGSCLPLLLQMPIFMGLYFALQESIQFRLERFLWIPNLAAPDMFLWWSESIPFLSDPDYVNWIFPPYLGPYLNVLPVASAVLMSIQQQMMTPPPADESQEAQQKMMRFMPIVFAVIFYRMPAGLCIYFIASSLWGLAERKMLPRKKVSPVAEVQVSSPRRGGGGPPGRGGGGPPGRGARNQPKKPQAPPGTLDKLKNWWAEVLKQAQKK
jgi:YidC/Oxa1 family membrane protein insertase